MSPGKEIKEMAILYHIRFIYFENIPRRFHLFRMEVNRKIFSVRLQFDFLVPLYASSAPVR